MELFRAIPVGEEAVIANAHEALGKDVEKEASEELDGVKGHGALSALLSVVLVAEGDLAVVEGEESLVGDGDAVGVAGEVFEDLLGTAEGGLGVDDPFFVAQGFEKTFPGFGMLEILEPSVECEVVVVESALEMGEELSLKQPTENVDGKEEAVATTHPAFAVETQAAAGNDAVEMRMRVKSLSPGMEQGEAAELRPQVFRVSAQRQ
jgi:hypothetical protein